MTTSERETAIRGSEAVPATCMVPIVTPAPILHPAIASIPRVIEPLSLSSQQINQHVSDYGQSITANPGTLNSFNSLTMLIPFISTVSPLEVHISQSLKEKIQNNKFVHLNKLQYHDPMSTQTNQIVFEDGTFKSSQRSKNKTSLTYLSRCILHILVNLFSQTTIRIFVFIQVHGIHGNNKKGADNMYHLGRI